MINSIQQGNVSSVQQTQQNVNKVAPKTDRRFQAFVEEALKENQQIETVKPKSTINLSNHAVKRLEQRGIELDEDDMTKIEEAFETLDNKGAKNSLIIYNDLSIIASITNRTIITASLSDEMQEVTNIDSAILVQQ